MKNAQNLIAKILECDLIIEERLVLGLIDITIKNKCRKVTDRDLQNFSGVGGF